MLADFIAYRLCGEGATDLSLASRTLMLDLHQKRWHQETLAQTGIDQNRLAPLVPGGTALGYVKADAAALNVIERGVEQGVALGRTRTHVVCRRRAQHVRRSADRADTGGWRNPQRPEPGGRPVSDQ